MEKKTILEGIMEKKTFRRTAHWLISIVYHLKGPSYFDNVLTKRLWSYLDVKKSAI